MEYQVALLAPRELTAQQQEQKQKLLEAGNTAFDAENYRYALECFHRASVLDSGDLTAWNLLGLTFANLELPWEAWRSFKLALHAGPQELETLWYAGEFLFKMQDYVLARILLQRYAELEPDEEQHAEALEIIAEINQVLPPVEEAAEDEAGQMVELDEEGLPVIPHAAEQADGEEELEEPVEEAAPQFMASLVLQLTALGSKCPQCATMLPLDAPYCYNCFSLCYYEEG